MVAGKRACVGELPFIKPSDLVRLTITRTAWERPVPMIQLPPTESLPQHLGIMGATFQDEIWVGTQPNNINVNFRGHTQIMVKGKLTFPNSDS